MFQQCISNIYNAFTNKSQNWLYTDFKVSGINKWIFNCWQSIVEAIKVFWAKNLLKTSNQASQLVWLWHVYIDIIMLSKSKLLLLVFNDNVKLL